MVRFNSTSKTFSIPITSLKRKNHYFGYDDSDFEKLTRYYGFEKEEELLQFLKTLYTGLLINNL